MGFYAAVWPLVDQPLALSSATLAPKSSTSKATATPVDPGGQSLPPPAIKARHPVPMSYSAHICWTAGAKATSRINLI